MIISVLKTVVWLNILVEILIHFLMNYFLMNIIYLK